jgi:hypothetical protein
LSCRFHFKKNVKVAWLIRTSQLNKAVILLHGLLLLGILTGCGATYNMPLPVRPTAVEQFLMTQAVERSLDGRNAMPIPLTYGDTVSLDISGLTPEQQFFKGAIGGWLGERGLKIATESHDARYRIHVLVQALGTEQSLSLFGLPQTQFVLLPFGLPEIALYKAQKRSGHTRFRLDIYETATGKFFHSTSWFQGSTHFNEYTALFFFDWQSTDLIAPF